METGKKNSFIIFWISIAILAALIWTFFGTGRSPASVQDPNKIALPAMEPDIKAQISDVLGRSPYYIIYDMKKKSSSVVENPFLNDAHAVGLRVGAMLTAKGVGIVIGKNIGPEPIKRFNDLKLKVYIGADGTVMDGIQQYQNNQLILTDKPNVPTHYGLPGQTPCPFPGQPKTRVDNPMITPPDPATRAKQVAMQMGVQKWNGWTVICSECQTVISIPDQGAAPLDKIICPKCKSEIVLNLSNQQKKYFR